jgi:hypothetical protein
MAALNDREILRRLKQRIFWSRAFNFIINIEFHGWGETYDEVGRLLSLSHYTTQISLLFPLNSGN